MALDELWRSSAHYVVGLLTTLLEDEERAQIQNVRRALIEEQAAALRLPSYRVYLPKGASNAVYEARLSEALNDFKEHGIESIVFGDLFLEDVRAYREQFLGRLGVTGLFPLWHRDTTLLIQDFLARGYKAITTAVSANFLDRSFAGRVIDQEFLNRLPPHVDPCGERGEFHTFVYGGPLFAEEISFRVGETTAADNHFFCDLLPA